MSGDGFNAGTADARVREAANLTRVHAIAVACPKDLITIENVVRRTGLSSRLRVRELAELVDEAMRPSHPLAGIASTAQAARF